MVSLYVYIFCQKLYRAYVKMLLQCWIKIKLSYLTSMAGDLLLSWGLTQWLGPIKFWAKILVNKKSKHMIQTYCTYIADFAMCFDTV